MASEHGVSGGPTAEDEAVLAAIRKSAERFRVSAPDAVVVGGSGAALWGGQRDGSAANYAMVDLSNRFEIVLDALASEGDTVAGRGVAAAVDAAALGGIETRLARITRTRPLRAAEVALPPEGFVRAPTAAETLRVKAFLVVWRNRTRDYLELAMLSDRFGVDAAAKILAGIDGYYADPDAGALAVATQLARQLADPHPADPKEPGRMALDPTLPAHWRPWDRVRAVCRRLAAAIVEGDSGASREWTSESLRHAVEHGDLADWRSMVTTFAADPWGRLSRQAERLLKDIHPYGVPALITAVLERARTEAEDAERARVAEQVQSALARSGLTQAEFASYIGTSASRLSTYQSGKVTPSAAMMLRIERVAAQSA